MSALTDRIAAEHRPLAASNGSTQGLSVRCSCGPTWHEDYTAHVAEVTEAAVRAQIAADIEDLEHTREEVRERQAAGYSVVWAEGYDEAVADAARIAKGGAS